MKNKSVFYDAISAYYDKMIDMNLALEKRQMLLGNFVTPQMKTTADVGCGTGVDSISLAKLGLSVTAFDPSKEMLNAAMINAKNNNVLIQFNNSSAEKIANHFYESFDLVVSLGNTLANIPYNLIEKSILKMYNLLKDKSSIIIQILNYEKILKEKQKIVNITRKENQYFVRFYDFGKIDLVFNILKFDADNLSNRSLISTKIYPYTLKKLKTLFEAAGFNKIQIFGSLNKDKYHSNTSADIILSATK